MTVELLKSYLADIWADILKWETQKPHELGCWVAVLGVLLFLIGKILAPIGAILLFAAIVYMIYRLWADKQ